ncbi:hypothetical protein ACA910_002895 [Epithemia clementina (nom. ined.)]
MDQHWRSLYGKQTTKTIMGDDGNATEASLTTVGFRGLCFKCKKPGHRAVQCPEKKTGEKGAKSGSKNKNDKRKACNHCGKTGHEEANCWNKPENANKKPKWYKPGKDKGEQASAAIETGDNNIEIICMAIANKIEFPKNSELLSDPCVWIADTAATKHVTRHEEGKQNIRKQAVSVTMGNNIVEKATQVCDLCGIKCDSFGQAEFDLKLSDVALVPTAAFNLFSITMMRFRQVGSRKTLSLFVDCHRSVRCLDLLV